jgi:hypothetical protein
VDCLMTVATAATIPATASNGRTTNFQFIGRP